MSQIEESTLGNSISEAALGADPYPIYKRLQEERPVCWVPALGLWLVTRCADVEYICKHPDLFSAEIPSSALSRTIGFNMLHSEGAYHQRLRSIVEPAFRSRAIGHYPTEVIEGMARELVQGFSDRGRADLVSEFAQPLSIRVLKRVLGITVTDDQLLRWSDGLATGASNFTMDPDRQAYAKAMSKEIDEHLLDHLDQPKEIPSDTALHAMLSAEKASKVSREEILSNVKLLIIGGLKTSSDLISVSLFALLQHPDQLSQVVADPKLIDSSIEEAIRWLSPVGTATRRTTGDCKLSGVELPAGAMVAGVLAAANRDPRVFTDPDRFDIRRREGSHLAFAAGPHACLGALLGRFEGRVGLRTLFETVKGLQIDPEKTVKIRGWEFRAPIALETVFQLNSSGDATF